MLEMRIRSFLKLLLWLFVLILLFLGCTRKSPVGPSEKLLATIPDRFEDVSQETFSPDGKQVAYRVKAKDKEFVVLNDKSGPEYDHVNL